MIERILNFLKGSGTASLGGSERDLSLNILQRSDERFALTGVWCFCTKEGETSSRVGRFISGWHSRWHIRVKIISKQTKKHKGERGKEKRKLS